MPDASTYPGVYVEELPSGVRTIAGVATSVTAFVGRALRGLIDEPVIINNYGDFERIFGGLWHQSSLGYAVQDFYWNGGGQAIIVRLFHSTNQPSTATLNANGLPLIAAAPGAWGNNLRARIELVDTPGWAERYGLQEGELFNLTVRDTKTGVTEAFQNVSIKDSPRQVAAVLANSSMLVRAQEMSGDTMPAEHASVPDIWTDDTASSKVESHNQADDGDDLDQSDFTGTGKEAAQQGLYALEKSDLFNLLCIPPYLAKSNLNEDVDADLVSKTATYCEKRRAMLIVYAPVGWTDAANAKDNQLGTFVH